MSSTVEVTVSGQRYVFPGHMTDSEVMRSLGLNPNDYTYASNQRSGVRTLTFTPKMGTKGAGTEYNFMGQTYRFESPVSVEEARALIASQDASVNRATFQSTGNGGTFVLQTDTKGVALA